MNKLALTALASALALSAGMAQAKGDISHTKGDPTGTVTIKGMVLTNSCKIDHDSKNLTVLLNPVMDRAVDAAERNPIATKDFRIRVKDCGEFQGHGYHFEPKLAWDNHGHSINDKGDLVNTANLHSNVALRILDSDNKRVNLRDANARYESERSHHGSKERVYKFSVGYIKGDYRGGVMPGKVSAQANYSITYL